MSDSESPPSETIETDINSEDVTSAYNTEEFMAHSSSYSTSFKNDNFQSIAAKISGATINGSKDDSFDQDNFGYSDLELQIDRMYKSMEIHREKEPSRFSTPKRRPLSPVRDDKIFSENAINKGWEQIRYDIKQQMEFQLSLLSAELKAEYLAEEKKNSGRMGVRSHTDKPSVVIDKIDSVI